MTPRILIEWGAAPNANKGDGWVPLLRVNGHLETSTWYRSGCSEDVARVLAWAYAVRERDRWSGEWDIEVREVSA